MTDTFERTANNKEIAGMFRNCSDEFAKELGLKNNDIGSLGFEYTSVLMSFVGFYV